MAGDKKNQDIDDKINLLKDEIKGFDDILPDSDALYSKAAVDDKIEKLKEFSAEESTDSELKPFPEKKVDSAEPTSPILKTPPVTESRYYNHETVDEDVAHALSGSMRELDKKINLLTGVISKATDDVTKNSDKELFDKLDNVINLNVEVSRKLDSLITSMNEGFANLRVIAKDINLRSHSKSIEGDNNELPEFDPVKKLPETREPESKDYDDVRPLRPNLAPKPPTGSDPFASLRSKEGNKYDL